MEQNSPPPNGVPIPSKNSSTAKWGTPNKSALSTSPTNQIDNAMRYSISGHRSPPSSVGTSISLTLPDPKDMKFDKIPLRVGQLDIVKNTSYEIIVAWEDRNGVIGVGAVSRAKIFHISPKLTAGEFLQTLFKEVVKSPTQGFMDCALFIPVHSSRAYPNGHWIQQDEFLETYTLKDIFWFKLRPRKLSMIANVSGIQERLTIEIDPYSTSKEIFHQVLHKVSSSPSLNGAKMKDYPQWETWGLSLTFLTEQSTLPLSRSTGNSNTLRFARKKSPSSGSVDAAVETSRDFRESVAAKFWLADYIPLAQFDLINQGGLHIERKKWDISVIFEGLDFVSTRKFNLDPFETVEKSLQFIIDSVSSLTKSKDGSAYLLMILILDKVDVKLHPSQPNYYCVGKILNPKLRLLDYYNTWRGHRNNTFVLFPVMTTSQIHLPDGRTETLTYSHHVTVAELVKMLCEKLGITNPFNFGLYVVPVNKQERWCIPEISLIEQGAGSRDKLLFKNQFPLSPTLTLVNNGLNAVHYTYCQLERLCCEGLISFQEKKIHVELNAILLKIHNCVFDSSFNFSMVPEDLFLPSAKDSETAILSLYYEKFASRNEDQTVFTREFVTKCQRPIDSCQEPVKELDISQYFCNAKGIYPKDFGKKAKCHLHVKWEEKKLTILKFSKTLSSFKFKFELNKIDFLADNFKIEKDLEDSRTLTMWFLDGPTGARKLELAFSSYTERQCFWNMMNLLRNAPKEHNLRIFTETWNIGSAQPPPVEDWIQRKGSSKSESDFSYDLYVIGFQECKWKKEGEEENSWNAILKSYFESSDFSEIGSCSMWEIGFGIYIRKSLLKFVTNVKSDTKPTGFANIVGNKGGVGISFKFLDSSFCFVNSHLPARAERVLNRNQDYQGLIDGLNLGIPKFDLFTQFDHLFWIGDLNYRIEQTQREKIYSHLQFNNYEALLSADQLRKEMEGNRTFYAFKEGRINFPPTYRYEKGSTEWSKKKLQNVPSYCDRILWKSQPDLESCVKQDFYTSFNQVLTSDHRPVAAGFQVSVKLANDFLSEKFSFPKFAFSTATISLYHLEIIKSHGFNCPTNNMTSITVKSPLLDGNSCTIPMMKNLANTWKAKSQVEVLGPILVPKSGLLSERFVVQVMDSDVVGSCNLVFPAFVNSATPVPFVSPLVFKGLMWGYLKGFWDVTWI